MKLYTVLSAATVFTGLALQIAATPAFATPLCLGNICVGGTVIDSNDRIGSVSAVGDNVVYYQVNGYSYSGAPSQLTASVDEKNGLRRNVTVVDSHDRVGVIQYVFVDGRAQYVVNGYTYVANDMVGEVDHIGSLVKNGILIDEHDRVCRTNNLFRDGRAYYECNGYTYVSKTVSPSVTELGGIHSDMTVVDENDRVGTATNVFADGRIYYVVNGYTYVSKTVSPSVTEFGGVHANMTIIDGNDRVGTATNVFADGRVYYVVNGYTYVSKNVQPEIPNKGRVTHGAIVIDENDRIGQVNNVFHDGRVYYTVNGYTFIASALAASVSSVDAEPSIITNKIIIDSNNRVGTVRIVFEDGRVNYEVNGYTYIVRIGQISPEVESHTKYVKNHFYATSGHDAGKITRFFKDGRMLLSLTNSSVVETVLFDQVAELANVRTGSVVIDPNGHQGHVELVFENGTVLANYEYSYRGRTEQEAAAGEIMGFDQAKFEQNKHSWITAMAYNVQNHIPDGMSFAGPFGGLVVLEADYANLKKLLLEELDKHPNLIRNDHVRLEVRKILGDETVPTTPAPAPRPTTPRNGRRGD